MLQPQTQYSSKPNLKTWWKPFALNTKPKKDVFEGPYRAHDDAEHPVFGKPLKESLKYASVQISTANANGDLYVWGHIPVVVAKCGLYLKEHATEVPGTFRVNGSNKRMRDLQASFESPPRYGKSLDWKQENYTTHDVASVFRRYLTQMPEPVIPHDMYHYFRDALAKQPFNQEEVITTYKSLIRRMPRPNQYLLLYVLDLLSVFARKSEKNLMTATNLAVIFRPGLISHPQHEMSPQEHALSQKVLEFLIAQQDWFMLDISPPPGSSVTTFEGAGGGPSTGGGGSGGGGPGGKWREGTSTPTRRGTGGSVENTSGGATPPANTSGAWHTHHISVEAGPSNPHSDRPSKQRKDVSGFRGALPESPVIIPTWSEGSQNRRSVQRSQSSHSPTAPDNLNMGWGSRSQAQPPPLHQSSQSYSHPGQGQWTEHVRSRSTSTATTPHSSSPPSPVSPSSPSNQQQSSWLPAHTVAQSPPLLDSQQQPQQKRPRPIHSATQPLPNNNTSAGSNGPIHYRFSHNQSQSHTHHHPHEPSPLAIHNPLAPVPSSPLGSGSSADVDEMMVIPSSRSDDGGEVPSHVGGAWKLISRSQVPQPLPVYGPGGDKGGGGGGGFISLGKKDKALKASRRRTAVDPSELRTPGQENSSENGNGSTVLAEQGATVTRSRTLPSRRKGVNTSEDEELSSALGDKENSSNLSNRPSTNGHGHTGRRVLKKQRRTSGNVVQVAAVAS